jgi:hypothetical protein
MVLENLSAEKNTWNNHVIVCDETESLWKWGTV